MLFLIKLLKPGILKLTIKGNFSIAFIYVIAEEKREKKAFIVALR